MFPQETSLPTTFNVIKKILTFQKWSIVLCYEIKRTEHDLTRVFQNRIKSHTKFTVIHVICYSLDSE